MVGKPWRVEKLYCSKLWAISPPEMYASNLDHLINLQPKSFYILMFLVIDSVNRQSVRHFVSFAFPLSKDQSKGRERSAVIRQTKLLSYQNMGSVSAYVKLQNSIKSTYLICIHLLHIALHLIQHHTQCSFERHSNPTLANDWLHHLLCSQWWRRVDRRWMCG